MTKFKVSKIPNIEKSVCCAEQKIACNYAFMWEDAGKKIFNSNNAEFVKSEAYIQIENSVTNSIKNNPKMKRYNLDVIIIAFRQGFKEFCKSRFSDRFSYEFIGNTFKIPYEIY